jgi:2,4-dienoyl-CoA reductase-like NADH-dependent reductase (Old Yellow Enzyme family)
MNTSIGSSVGRRPPEDPEQELQRLWEPLDIGPTRVKHRVMYTAQTMGYGENHLISDRHIAFYRERARGGVALMVTEQQAGHPISKGSFLRGCTAHDKGAVPQFAKLADAIHEFGAKQFVQLFGAGVHDKGTTIYDEWHPLWAASRITSIVHHEVPMVMGQAEIDDVASAFGESALNVKTGGLDGVEIHGAHSYLLAQFLSPAYNKRDDTYGGSIRNRCRFPIEVAESIRRAVDGDITVGIRLSFDEYMGDAGITGEQTEEIVEVLVGTDLFDYFSISCGGYHTFHRTVSPMQIPQGFLEEAGKKVKAIVGDRAKVFLVGRILDVDVADRLIAQGATDMAAMTRAQLADPFLVKKAQEKRAEDIVRCIGANVCEAHAFDQKLVPCVMNPAAGRERVLGAGTLSRVSGAEQRQVIVVGGGPAGMRSAGTLAERGHEVTLFEAARELGGHINLLKQLPTRAGWQDAIGDLERPLERFDVDVRIADELADAEAGRLGPDVIVCATGSGYVKTGPFSAYRPERNHIPGAELATVHDVASATESVLADPDVLGPSVLIYDELGEYLSLGLAELLAGAGVQVEIVTPRQAVGEEVIRTLEWNWIAPRLLDNGVTLTAQHTIESIAQGSVMLSGMFGGPQLQREVDSVVVSLPRVPRDELYRAIAESVEDLGEPGPRVHLVGDALAPRSLEAVIFEAETLARAV